MAKKKFGLSSTLNKNKSEEPSLPKRVPLTRSKKNLEEVAEKVEAIHDKPLGMVEEPTVEITVDVKDEDMMKVVEKVREVTKAEVIEIATKPKKTKKAPTKKSTIKQPERMVRITVDTPRSIHVKLKIKAIEQDITIRDYIIGLIKDDLGLD